MAYKRQTLFNIILILIVTQPVYTQIKKDINPKEYDIVVTIKDTAQEFFLNSFKNESPLINRSNPVFRNYYLMYTKPENNLPKNVDTLEGNFITQSNHNQHESAAINLGFWNLPIYITNNSRIKLSDKTKYYGSSTSIIFLMKDYASLSRTKTNTYLFTIPFENNKDIDSIFPGLTHQSSILFILWERQSTNLKQFPREIEGLKISITNLRTGQTTYYSSYSNLSTERNEENKRNKKEAITKTEITNKNKPKEKVNDKPIIEKKSIKYRLSFKLIGPKKLNWQNFPKPKSLELNIPVTSFINEGVYYYDPKIDTINPHPEFAKLWTIPNNKKIIIYKYYHKKLPQFYVLRAAENKNFQIVIKGNLPKKEKIEYTYKSNLFYPKDEKTKKIKIKGTNEQVENVKLFIPDTILSGEEIKFTFFKPYNYNLSLSGVEHHDWKKNRLDVIVDHTNDTIIKLDLDRIPPFQFFYIDLSGFNNLQKIKNLLKEKIGKQNNDYFIFVSNSNKPLIWKTGDDLDDLLTRISLMRPEPPLYNNEAKYIKPYIDEMIEDKSIYSIDRREVDFNFLFSESFLNHSSQRFILDDCLGNINVDSKIKSGKIKIYSYSTVEKPLYIERENNIDKGKINYINFKTSKYDTLH